MLVNSIGNFLFMRSTIKLKNMAKVTRTHSHNTDHSFHPHKHNVEIGLVEERPPHPFREYLFSFCAYVFIGF